MGDNDDSGKLPGELADDAYKAAQKSREHLRVVTANDADAWRGWLKRTDNGLRAIEANAMLFLENHDDLTGLVAFDRFRNEIIKRRAPPWAGEAGTWSDADTSQLSKWMALTEGFYPADRILDRAVKAVAQLNAFHSVVDWLEALEPWDGTERLPRLLSDVFETPQDPYHEHVGTGWLVSMIARVMQPGCKVDTMLVLEGKQGIGKGTALIELVGIDWHMEVTEAPGSREFSLSLRGSWLCEIGEMHSFTRSEIARVKQTVTTRQDKYRSPYDRYPQTHPRQSVFVGTSNDDQYLSDSTGGRRFLPVACQTVNAGYIRENRSQLFAEALQRYRDGFEWWEYPAEVAREMQEARYVADAWEPLVVAWTQDPNRDDITPGVHRDEKGYPEKVTMAAFLLRAVLVDYARQDRSCQMRMANILKRMQWQQVRLGADSRTRVYARPKSWALPQAGEGVKGPDGTDRSGPDR